MYFQLERLINDLENVNFRSNFDPRRGSFSTISGQKTRFLDFFKVVLELFRNYLRIVFDVKGSFSGVFLALKVHK